MEPEHCSGGGADVVHEAELVQVATTWLDPVTSVLTSIPNTVTATAKRFI